MPMDELLAAIAAFGGGGPPSTATISPTYRAQVEAPYIVEVGMGAAAQAKSLHIGTTLVQTNPMQTVDVICA